VLKEEQYQEENIKNSKVLLRDIGVPEAGLSELLTNLLCMPVNTPFMDASYAREISAVSGLSVSAELSNNKICPTASS
jgi:hypothetical protein